MEQPPVYHGREYPGLVTRVAMLRNAQEIEVQIEITAGHQESHQR